jgi:hypothetical protein
MPFNPDQFMQAQFNGKLDTVIPALPEDDYRAIIDDVTFREVDTKEGLRNIMRLRWKITDDAKLAQINRKSASVNQDLWLDITPAGALDEGEGKNVGLGRVLEALNLNGQNWSPGMLKGMGPCILRITQRADQKNSENVFNDVNRVTKLS